MAAFQRLGQSCFFCITQQLCGLLFQVGLFRLELSSESGQIGGQLGAVLVLRLCLGLQLLSLLLAQALLAGLGWVRVVGGTADGTGCAVLELGCQHPRLVGQKGRLGLVGVGASLFPLR